MRYENPKIPENINTSKEHPLKEFSILLIAAVILVILGSLLFGFAGSWLAGKIPFSTEKKITSLYDMSQQSDDKTHPKISQYLQTLADKISKAQNLPAEMKIITHYMDDETVNAFATLGGNLFIYRGLLEKLPSENSLVTLLGHEIAHVKYRHPIKSLGRGVVMSIALSAVIGTDAQVLGDAGMLTILKFSRDMEKQSDEEAMQTLHSLYGHLNGGTKLFKIFQKMRVDMDSKEPSEFFSTHPLDENRILNFSIIAKQKGWKLNGELTPLPNFFKKSLN